jgi:hypothetical protein
MWVASASVRVVEEEPTLLTPTVLMEPLVESENILKQMALVEVRIWM